MPHFGGRQHLAGEDDGVSTRMVVSQQRHQVRIWDGVELAWVRTRPWPCHPEVRISRFGRSRPRWTVAVPDCRLAHVERGDYLTVSSDWLKDERPGLSYQYRPRGAGGARSGHRGHEADYFGHRLLPHHRRKLTGHGLLTAKPVRR